MEINEDLKNYINNNILPLYDNNYLGDGRKRVEYVLDRSQEIVKENDLDIDENMLYAAICFHDVRLNNDDEAHEIQSANFMYNDDFLKHQFTDEQRQIIKEAIEDQRAKTDKEPRSIYGKILSSASRNTSIEQCLERSYNYNKKLNPDSSEDEIFENAYEALNKKFGENGYAKFYFEDEKYEDFLAKIRAELKDKDAFISHHKDYINNKNK